MRWLKGNRKGNGNFPIRVKAVTDNSRCTRSEAVCVCASFVLVGSLKFSMSWEFYNSIIEEECKYHGLFRQMIRPAFKRIANAYCENALKTGHTLLNYDDPTNRCAYLHKFAAMHTALVHQYFEKFLQEEKSEKILASKETLNICCLGGGPGTDIVGIFKALAKIPHFRKKVVRVVILDICRGWCNSFKFIISSLLDGKIEEIPADFVDTSKFVAEIIEVNLLEPLPFNVVDAIAAADIVCSIKFISAIYSHPACFIAMKTIADNIKPHSLFLFIDNLCAQIYKFVKYISEISRFEIIFGPFHENFKMDVSEKSLGVFKGVSPSAAAKVSVIGMLKLNKTGGSDYGTLLNSTLSLNSTDDSWMDEVESEIDDDINALSNSLLDDEKFHSEISTKESKFTQTDPPNIDDCSTMQMANFLESLTSALNSLLVNVNTYVQKTSEKKCCCCHS